MIFYPLSPMVFVEELTNLFCAFEKMKARNKKIQIRITKTSF